MSITHVQYVKSLYGNPVVLGAITHICNFAVANVMTFGTRQREEEYVVYQAS